MVRFEMKRIDVGILDCSLGRGFEKGWADVYVYGSCQNWCDGF